MKLIKKALSLILSVVMVLGLMPAVFATGEDLVYISVSYDGQYITDQNGSYIAYISIPMAEITAVDLDSYGLSDYWYDQDGDGANETTALQLVIYAHENIYGGDFSEVIFTGSPGSSYFQGGIFGFDENLNYYLNGEYPLASEGWGATSDQIVLQAGDYLDIASFSSWNFYGDSNYGFHFFADSEGIFTQNYSAETGAELPVKLVRSYSGMGSGAAVYDEAGYTLSYGTSLYNAAGTVTTDDSGCTTITFDTAGTWYLWCDGGYGCEFPEDIVSTPAYAKVTVTAGEVVPPADSKVDAWNITLTDALNVNFHLNISESVEATASVRITVANTVVNYAAKELEKTEDGLHTVCVKLAAAQMTDNIVVEIINNDTVECSESYTIRQYADAVLKDETLSQYHTLVKEMLNYGATAQTYFDYHGNALANEGITGAGAMQIPADADREPTVSGSADGVSFYGSTLLFRDRIAVRYYFQFQGDINQVSFSANGTACSPVLKNGMYYVEVSDILPQNLEQEIELIITDASGSEMTIYYSPMNYIIRMSEKGSQSLQALLQALYNYHLASKKVAALG